MSYILNSYMRELKANIIPTFMQMYIIINGREENIYPNIMQKYKSKQKNHQNLLP